MRIKSMIVMLLSLMFILPNEVYGLTFNDGDNNYNLEKYTINSSCVEGLAFSGSKTKDGYYIFENSENGDNQIKILNDGTCSKLTNQEMLDYYNGVGSDYYEVRFDENDDLYIYHMRWSASDLDDIFIKTSDTVIDPNKEYFEIEIYDGGYSSGPATSGNIDNYYESIKLTIPKSTKQISGVTYYRIDNNIATEVKEEEFNEDEILDYYVLSDGSNKDIEEKVVKLPDSYKELNTDYIIVVKSSLDGKYYVAFESSNGDYNDIYNTEGELLFSNVLSFAVVNSLYVVSDNDIMKFYNFNKELVYEIDNNLVGDSKVDGNISYIIALDTSEQEELMSIYKLELSSNNGDIDNPQTFDNVVVMFIMLGISIIGIIGTLIYTKKYKKDFN